MNTVTTSARLRNLIAAAAIGALAAGFSSLAAAADASAEPHVIVKYGDLNVSSPRGAAALYSRIRWAAETVCPRFERYELASRQRMDACVHKAITDAVIAVNQPALVAAYNAKNSTPLPRMLASGQR
ncbi:MAG TPA: UrcA family protein [Steroidobacteraceae bacterium]|jgi:UrcA family protein